MIDLKDDVPPIHRFLYKMSPLDLKKDKIQIQSMLKDGLIRPSDSPYSVPILFVAKRNGTLRLCIDCHWFNKKTVKNRYPLTFPEEFFVGLGSIRVFRKLISDQGIGAC